VVEFIGPLGRGNGNFGKKVSNFWGLVLRPLSGYCVSRSDLKDLVIDCGYAPMAEIAHFGELSWTNFHVVDRIKPSELQNLVEFLETSPNADCHPRPR